MGHPPPRDPRKPRYSEVQLLRMLRWRRSWWPWRRRRAYAACLELLSRHEYDSRRLIPMFTTLDKTNDFQVYPMTPCERDIEEARRLIRGAQDEIQTDRTFESRAAILLTA